VRADEIINNKAESLKLAELRCKTDRQLTALINARLDAGLDLVRMGTLQIEAEKTYAEARFLYPWINDLTRADRRRIELKLVQLRELLDNLSSDAGLRLQSACS
jgi:hypothetical protein